MLCSGFDLFFIKLRKLQAKYIHKNKQNILNFRIYCMNINSLLHHSTSHVRVNQN